MPKPYPISIEVDGRRCRGDWLLLQGCRVRVRSAWGNETVEAGCDARRFREVATRTLERLVRADDKQRADWKADQARRRAKLSRPRRTRKRIDDAPANP